MIDYLAIFWSNLARMGWVIVPWGAMAPEKEFFTSICGHDDGLDRDWCT